MNRLIGLVVWMMLAAPAHAQFKLVGSHVAAGTTSASGGEFTLEATIGQAAFGSASGGSFTEWLGFWYLVHAPAGPGSGSAQVRLTALQVDDQAGGALSVAVEVRTSGLVNRTLGAALIDIDYDGSHLAFSGHSVGLISGSGTTVEVADLSGDPELGNGSGAFVRLSVATSGIGTGNSGYDVGEEYVLFGRLDFTITEAGFGAGSTDLFVRPGSLSIGFFDSPQNTSQSGQIVPAIIDEISHLYQMALPVNAEIENIDKLTQAYILGALYPNPFNSQARFSIVVQHDQHVQIDVFDLLGRRVAVLHEERLTANEAHLLTFDAGHLPSGTYVIRIRGAHFSAALTAVLFR